MPVASLSDSAQIAIQVPEPGWTIPTLTRQLMRSIALQALVPPPTSGQRGQSGDRVSCRRDPGLSATPRWWTSTGQTVGHAGWQRLADPADQSAPIYPAMAERGPCAHP